MHCIYDICADEFSIWMDWTGKLQACQRFTANGARFVLRDRQIKGSLEQQLNRQFTVAGYKGSQYFTNWIVTTVEENWQMC